MKSVQKISIALLTISCVVTIVGTSAFYVGYNENKNFVDDVGAEPVAYIDSDPNTKYMTFEAAINAAANMSGGQNIYAIVPSDTSTVYTISSSTGNLTLAEGDSLIFPYAVENGTPMYEASTDKTSLGSYYSPQLAYTVKLEKNTKLTLSANSHLYVGGETGGSNTEQQGITNGKYVDFVMCESSIINSEGELKVTGFIKLENEDAHAEINLLKDSSVRIPLTLLDFPGGTQATLVLLLKSYLFFREYDFPNIQVPMNFNYGSSLYALIKIYMSSRFYSLEGQMIGNDSCLIKLENQSSSLSWVYGKRKTNNDELRNCINVSTYGDLSLNSLSLELMGQSVETSKYYFPIYEIFQFEINGRLNVNNKLKFLPGSKIKINPDTIVNLNADMIIYHLEDNDSLDKYPTTEKESLLFNNGTININQGFNGTIYIGDNPNENTSINVGDAIDSLDENIDYSQGDESGERYFPAEAIISLDKNPENAKMQNLSKNMLYHVNNQHQTSFYYPALYNLSVKIDNREGIYKDYAFEYKIIRNDGTIESYNTENDFDIIDGEKIIIDKASNIEYVTINNVKYTSDELQNILGKEIILDNNTSINYAPILEDILLSPLESISTDFDESTTISKDGGTYRVNLVLTPSENIKVSNITWTIDNSSYGSVTPINNGLSADIKIEKNRNFLKGRTITITISLYDEVSHKTLSYPLKIKQEGGSIF